MTSETQLISEIWDIMRDHVPVARRQDIAIQVLRSFEEYGFDPDDLKDLADEDVYLQQAYQDLYDEDEEEIEEDQ